MRTLEPDTQHAAGSFRTAGSVERTLGVIGTVVVAAAGVGASGYAWAVTDGNSFWELWVTCSGALLLLAGGIHLLVRPAAGSWPALAPGCALFLWVWQVTALVDPNFVRDLILAHLALGVLICGLVFGWQAPVVLGGAATVVHGVTRFLWPAVTTLPWGALVLAGLAAVAVLVITYRIWVRQFTRLAHTVSAMR